MLTYTCRRKRNGPAGTIKIRAGQRVSPSPLDRFLTARRGLHTSWYGRTLYIPNEHPDWELHEAQVLDVDDELVAATGVQAQGPPVSTLFSPGVPARFTVPSIR